jgi:DNA-binding NarL/FixJ family response regulator
MSISILIADDHDIIRAGLKDILRGQPGYKVTGEAVDAESALAQVEKLKPDIILLDISMPKLSGLDIIKNIHQVSPETKVLVISLHKTSAYVMKALKAGVKGYLNKENAAEELLPALDKIVRGKVYLASSVSSCLVEKVIKDKDSNLQPDGSKAVLTLREQEVLRLVAEGKTAQEIAGLLYISRRTVETHKSSIQEKLGLNKTSDLIKYAVKHGIVDLEEY